MLKDVNGLIKETQTSYYEYVLKLQPGCQYIIETLKAKDVQAGASAIQALSEGLMWLVEAEDLLALHNYKINSPIRQITPLFLKLNQALQETNFEQVMQLIEEDFIPLLKDSRNWIFEEIIN